MLKIIGQGNFYEFPWIGETFSPSGSFRLVIFSFSFSFFTRLNISTFSTVGLCTSVGWCASVQTSPRKGHLCHQYVILQTSTPVQWAHWIVLVLVLVAVPVPIPVPVLVEYQLSSDAQRFVLLARIDMRTRR